MTCQGPLNMRGFVFFDKQEYAGRAPHRHREAAQVEGHPVNQPRERLALQKLTTNRCDDAFGLRWDESKDMWDDVERRMNGGMKKESDLRTGVELESSSWLQQIEHENWWIKSLTTKMSRKSKICGQEWRLDDLVSNQNYRHVRAMVQHFRIIFLSNTF